MNEIPEVVEKIIQQIRIINPIAADNVYDGICTFMILNPEATDKEIVEIFGVTLGLSAIIGFARMFKVK